jgi:hypothetical protein
MRLVDSTSSLVGGAHAHRLPDDSDYLISARLSPLTASVRARPTTSAGRRRDAGRCAVAPGNGPPVASLEWLCCKKKADLLEWKEKNTRGAVVTEQHPFKWRHFQPEIILLCVR